MGGSFREPQNVPELINQAKVRNQIFAESIRKRQRDLIISGARNEIILNETVSSYTEKLD